MPAAFFRFLPLRPPKVPKNAPKGRLDAPFCRFGPLFSPGRLAEQISAIFLILNGYRLLARNRRHWAEVDILAFKNNTLVLVEVKSRQSFSREASPVAPAQRARLAAVARHLAAEYPSHTIRLDIILLAPRWPFIKHFPAALDPLASW